ncbi:hypothetical protein HK103_005292 [Boothiomyces macroporosus]|uniref:LicD/FKTN/FKRP nucleotidyltransferase domain-containing protein n=1 Tax=Boothiomyces macroporosus TaxID=261099 RepID=A0AAD5UJK6_9FUNG|nr:hypothetical protein HK103_005292 [Boothiomyces macroporosus]
MYLLPTLRRSRCIFISSSVILNLAVLYVFGFFETDNNFEVEVFSTQQPILIQPYQSDVTLTGCGPECVVQYQVLPPDQQHTFTKWERKKNPEGYPFEIPLGTRLLPTLQSFVEPPTTLAQNKDLKYFYEDEKIHHLDSRFSGGYEDHKQKLLIIHELFKNWAIFSDSVEIPYWIMHGTLLGWKWGGRTMPFDDDIDIQVVANSLYDLRKYQNQTIANHYILEVNHNHVVRGKQDNNVIDARFIDTRNGHFIDITGVSEYRRFLSCKTPRYYNYEQLFPLVRTTFEGIPTWRPNQYQKVLQREYRDKPYYKKGGTIKQHEKVKQ